MRSPLSATLSAQRVALPRVRRVPPVLVREVAWPMAFILAILASNYALTSMPNVKLFDLLVFAAGYTLGFRRGATVAAGVWLVYGNFNPWGPTTGPLLLTLMTAETVYALAGALARRVLPPQKVRLGLGWATLLFGAAALVTTVTYDVAANIYTGIAWADFAGSDDVGRWVRVALTNPGAMYFYFVHAGSNLAFFTMLGPGVVKAAGWARESSPWGR